MMLDISENDQLDVRSTKDPTRSKIPPIVSVVVPVASAFASSGDTTVDPLPSRRRE